MRSPWPAASVLLACSALPAPGQVRDLQPGGAASPATPRGCAPYAVALEAYLGEVELGALVACNADFAGPWSAAFAPGGEFLYVSLFSGNIGAENCLVARLDARTYELVNSFTAGLGPQEFAFTALPSGRMQYGFVSCSSASTVAVFDPEDNIVASIPIPFDPTYPYQTAFPFGLAASPDGSRIYVGTLDGSGDVHVIDTQTLALVPAATIHWGLDHGIARLAFQGDTLVVPLAEYLPGFTGSSAKVGFVDPDDPQHASSLTLFSASDGVLFPAAQDVAFGCGGKAYVAGFDMGARVFVIDVETRGLLRTIPTFTSQASGKFQGLGASDDGFLAVADFFTDEVAVINTRTDRWVRTSDVSLLGPHRQLMELVFDARGDVMLAPGLTTENLALFRLR